MAEPDPREANLPRWARERIEVARQKHQNLLDELRAKGGPVPTGLAVEIAPSEWIFMPRRATVRFAMGGEDAMNYAEVYMRENSLYVRTGFSRLLVQPEASNMIAIKLGGQ
jgi:hypothetical protein